MGRPFRVGMNSDMQRANSRVQTRQQRGRNIKFTFSWLKDHLETRAPLDEILTVLTDLGLEVEGVEDPAKSLGAFTIYRVIEAAMHPNAGKLRLRSAGHADCA